LHNFVAAYVVECTADETELHYRRAETSKLTEFVTPLEDQKAEVKRRLSSYQRHKQSHNCRFVDCDGRENVQGYYSWRLLMDPKN
jgi:hypothetical protein